MPFASAMTRGRGAGFRARVVSSAGKKTVVGGPFTETKELIAGSWLWQVKSMDEALERVRRGPDPMPGEEGILIAMLERAYRS